MKNSVNRSDFTFIADDRRIPPEDHEIVELYLHRDEDAIEQTHLKYGRYCHSIAYNILYSNAESDECVNDTYLQTWNSIPPNKPERLSAYLGKITRNLALNRCFMARAAKRYYGTQVILEEVSEFLPDNSSSEMSTDLAIRNATNAFLRSLPKQTRCIFVRRYWYMSSIASIARDYGLSQSNVKVTLMRARNKFKEYLNKEGINV